MSRRSSDTMRRSEAMGHGQQAIWDVIREQRSFTITDVFLQVDMHRKSVINYVMRLKKGGFVERADDFDRTYTYNLIKDAGRFAPRLNRDGKPVTQGTANANMWQSMRMLKEFTPNDIVGVSNTTKAQLKLTTVKAYCTILLKADYLRLVRAAEPPTKQAVYRLIRDTGPLPPQVQRTKQLFDPNTNSVAYRPGGTQ